MKDKLQRRLHYSWMVAGFLSCNGASYRGRGKLFMSESSEFPICRASLPSLKPSSNSLSSLRAFFFFVLFLCLRSRGSSARLFPVSLFLFKLRCTGIGVGTLSLSPSSHWPLSTAGSNVARPSNLWGLLCLAFFFLFRVKSTTNVINVVSGYHFQ